MDIEAYLRQQKQCIGKESEHVRDFAVFDFNHIPPQPLMREECRELVDAMLRFEASGIPTNLAIIGSRGSGKTLTLKYLQRIVPTQTKLEILYANCRRHNTTHKILSHLLGKRSTGRSLAQLHDEFLGQFTRRTVVLLDEAELFSPKDRQREILYMLSRSHRPYMIIMLSNSPQVLKQLDAATRSSLQPIPLHFKNYDADQIQTILADRARQGLHTWDKRRLAQIAALTVRLTNADARIAIKTLFYSVTQPAEDLDECFGRARRDIVIDMISNLSDANLVILWATASGQSSLAKDIYRRYCHFSQEQGDKPFSYVHFYSNLSYLQSMGLIALASTKVARTYTNRVLLTFDPDTVISLCNLRFS